MPGFDQRGPVGQGPLTGRRMGRCTNWGANVKRIDDTASDEQKENMSDNFQRRGFGFGWRGGRGGRGRGRGMGWQNRFRGGF